MPGLVILYGSLLKEKVVLLSISTKAWRCIHKSRSPSLPPSLSLLPSHLLLLRIVMLFLLSTIAVIAALLASVLASPISSEVGTFEKTRIFEKIALPPSGWVHDDAIVLDKDSMFMKLRIHLVQHNMPDFHDLAMKVYKIFCFISQTCGWMLRHLLKRTPWGLFSGSYVYCLAITSLA